MSENRQSEPAREPLRRPGAPRPVDPKDLQSLLDYRDERLRAESRLNRARQLEYDDRRDRTKGPEPDSPSPAPPGPSGRSGSRDNNTPSAGEPRQPGDSTENNRAYERLRRPAAPRPVDPEDLQSLLDYRDERFRAEIRLNRAKRLDHDPHRTNVPEPDDPPPATPATSNWALAPDIASDDQIERAAGQPSKRDVDQPKAGSASDGSPGSLHGDRSAMWSSDHRPDNCASSGALDAGAGIEEAGTHAENRELKPRDGKPSPESDQPGQRIDGEDVRDLELAALIDAAERAKTPSDGLSNRDRPPRHGDVDYQVDVPPGWSTTITDIDLVYEDTFWEIKQADGRDPNINTDKWIAKQLIGKLDRYVETRDHLQGWEEARIGYFINTADPLPEFKQRVEAAIESWQRDHPSVSARLRWRE